MKLIDKDALVAEIERLKDSEPYYPTLAERYAYNNGVNDAIDKIYSFQVKEVDLEKEHKEWLHKHFDGSRDHNASGDYLQRSSQLDMAKHFFELGLKAQKGEELC